jgi:hypothetical protein
VGEQGGEQPAGEQPEAKFACGGGRPSGSSAWIFPRGSRSARRALPLKIPRASAKKTSRAPAARLRARLRRLRAAKSPRRRG